MTNAGPAPEQKMGGRQLEAAGQTMAAEVIGQSMPTSTQTPTRERPRFVDRVLDPEATPMRWLTDHLTIGYALYAQVGYLDRAGVSFIAGPLQDMLERGGEVHIVVDSRENRPRRNDLAWILELFAPYGERATVTLIRDASPLHAKVFAIHASDGRHALVGSANFTAAGLAKNWEACVAICPTDTEILDQVDASFKAWRSHPAAVAIDPGFLASLAPPEPTGVSIPLVEGLLESLDGFEAAGSGAISGVPTGFTDLDRLLNGLNPGELVLIAGRPSMGKSTLALDIVRNASIRANVPALVMSFEMTRREITDRFLSAEARVPLHVLRSGQLTDKDWEKLAKCMEEVAEAPLFINDTCNPSIGHIATEIRRAVAEDGIEIAVVDYVQQLHVTRRTDSRQHEIAEVSRSFKHLARELRIPVIVISQLSRASEARTNRLPMLSDLRDSGGLEQDADIVIFVHREDYYDKESPRAGEADLIVAKHRNGPTDIITVAAQLHLSRFVDMAII
ncbi:DnaB-like helicase C-terminal domain-containing protein [Micromonospora carbonacea]|uniref:DnaB-like helicase C-terminal domain-containing protein n=1 Tax=Micromonospora carbonacea TaxID=47853 RepID=UPI003719FE7F